MTRNLLRRQPVVGKLKDHSLEGRNQPPSGKEMGSEIRGGKWKGDGK
jgi:hypothetical protein